MRRLAIFCLGVVLSVSANAERLRLVGGNISSGNGQNYDLGHGSRIFQWLKPDVVMIQEFNYKSNSVADIRAFVTNTFGSNFSYFREPIATNNDIPNGVISRYPILESGEWKDPKVDNRDFAWARIDIPGPRDLWAVSVHFLTSSSSNRNAEAVALVDYIEARVPAADYIVIGGDFNSDSRGESQFTTLREVVDTAGPHPADRLGNENTNNPTSGVRAKPYDSVFPSTNLRTYQAAVTTGSFTFPNGFVADTRKYVLPGDSTSQREAYTAELSPAMLNDSGSTNMQHMAIVKDFMLPDPLLIVTNSPLVSGTVGTSVSRTFSASGGSSSYTWSLASGSLPAGLTLSSAGVLSGNPSVSATFDFVLKVSDPVADPVTKAFTITVKEPLTLYLESYGLAANSAVVDSDSDGLPNLVEFLLGGNPISASDSIAPVLGFSADGLRARYDFAVLKSTGSVSWRVESSTNLIVWNPVIGGVNDATFTTISQSPTVNRITVSLPKGAEKTFLRVKVNSP